MAIKQFYATGDFRYGTRMLRAGDPVEMDALNAKIFTALKKISPDSPKGAVPAMMTENTGQEVPKPAAKRAPRKRIAKKRG